jgi:hypothetical protein
MQLRELGGMLLCQKDAFLCAARGVSLGIAFQQKLGVGFFGGEGFIMQKLEGDGLAFVHACGTVVKRDLASGQSLMVDTGCVVAYTPGVNFETLTAARSRRPLWRRRLVLARIPDLARSGCRAAVLAPGQSRLRRAPQRVVAEEGRCCRAGAGACRRHSRRRR